MMGNKNLYRSCAVSLISTTLLILAQTGTALPDWISNFEGNDIQIEGERTERGSTSPPGGGGGRDDAQQVSSPEKVPQYKFEPVCIPDLSNIDLNCIALNADCSVGAEGTLMTVLTAPFGQSPPQWADTGERVCRYSDRPMSSVDGSEIVLPTVTVEFFRRLPIAPSGLTVEPVPHTLIGAETNVYATPNEQTFNEEIDGFDVTVRAIPTSYTWSYGDGSSLGPTTQPGGPLPADRLGEKTATSHRYTETGDVQVSLTTTYRGDYSINGSAWIAISGEAQITSATVELSVWRSVVNNYADNCLDNPEGAGC